MPVQEGIINGLRLAHLFQQGHNGPAQLGKEGVQSRHVQPFLVFVQQSVIGGHLGMVIARELPVEGYDFLQIGRESGKIIVVLRPVPHVLSIIEQDGIGNVFLRGDPMDLIVAFADDLHFPFFLGIQLFGVSLQEGQQFPVFRVCQQIVGDLGQDLHGLAPALPGVAGSGGCGIQIENTHGMIVGCLGLLQFFQCLKGLLHGFVFHGNTLPRI